MVIMLVDRVSDPVSWVKFTQENIARSRGEREISEKLRMDIEICLRQCANDMVSQFQFINNALKARIQENTDVKHRLEMHLQKVGCCCCCCCYYYQSIDRSVDLYSTFI